MFVITPIFPMVGALIGYIFGVRKGAESYTLTVRGRGTGSKLNSDFTAE